MRTRGRLVAFALLTAVFAVWFVFAWQRRPQGEQRLRLDVVVPLTGDFSQKGHEHLRAVQRFIEGKVDEGETSGNRFRIVAHDNAKPEQRFAEILRDLYDAQVAHDNAKPEQGFAAEILRDLFDTQRDDAADYTAIGSVAFHRSSELNAAIRKFKSSGNSGEPMLFITPSATVSYPTADDEQHVEGLEHVDEHVEGLQHYILRACPSNDDTARVMVKAAQGKPILVVHDISDYAKNLKKSLERALDLAGYSKLTKRDEEPIPLVFDVANMNSQLTEHPIPAQFRSAIETFSRRVKDLSGPRIEPDGAVLFAGSHEPAMNYLDSLESALD